MTDIYDELCKIVASERLKKNEPLKKYTTFRVGGPAEYLVCTSDKSEIKKLICFCRNNEISFTILGNGSNVLISDSGLNGLVIVIKDNDAQVRFTECGSRVEAYVSAGMSLSAFAMQCANRGLAGLEFAAGIPGTVGGAVVMNAGAYGGEIKQRLAYAEVMDLEGNIFNLNATELKLGYRTSIIKEENYVVLSTVFSLEKGDTEQIKAVIADLNKQRRDKQPLEYPSAGSTFKRPEGFFAGKLIMDSGLAGFTVGGAQVSEKHCGFVINKNNATAQDIFRLMKLVSEKVLEDFGVKLEPEVKMIGSFE